MGFLQIIVCCTLISVSFAQEQECGMASQFLLSFSKKTKNTIMVYFEENGIFNETSHDCLLLVRNFMQTKTKQVSVYDTSRLKQNALPEQTEYVILFYSPAAHGFLQLASEAHMLFDYCEWVVLTIPKHEQELKRQLSTLEMYIDSEVVIATFQKSAIKLTDVYRRGPGTSLEQTNVGVWSLPSGLEMFKIKEKYDRRADLKGLTLKAVTVGVAKPFYVQYKEQRGKWVVNGGLFGETFNLLKYALNFTYTVRVIPGYSYGTRFPNGSWTGVTGALARGEVDITACELAMVNSRFSSIDYTLPIIKSTKPMYVRKAGATRVKWNAFLQPYSVDVYLGLLVGFLVFSVSLWILACIKKRLAEWCIKNSAKSPGEGNAMYFAFNECLWIFYGSLVQQGSPVEPQGLSLRIVFWVAYATFLVFNIGYGATLTSFLAVTKQNKPFNGFEGLYAKTDWKIGFIKNDFNHVIFETSDEDKIENKLWRDRVLPNMDEVLMKDVEGGIKKVLEGQYAFVILNHAAEDWMTRYLGYEEQCKVDVIHHNYIENKLAFGQRKRSPYRKLFSHFILKFMVTGQMQRLREKWLPHLPACVPPEEVQATPEDLVSLYTLFTIGFFASIVLVAFEYLYNNFLKFSTNKADFHQKAEGRITKLAT